MMSIKRKLAIAMIAAPFIAINGKNLYDHPELIPYVLFGIAYFGIMCWLITSDSKKTD